MQLQGEWIFTSMQLSLLLPVAAYSTREAVSTQKVERAQIFRACFKPELFTNKNAKIRVQAYFEHFEKLGLPSLEPGAYLLWAKISAQPLSPSPGSFQL